MQEEVENRTINVVIATTRLSARQLESGIRRYLNGHAQKKNAKRNVKVQVRQRQKEQRKAEGPHGKQTVKQLVRHSNGLKEVPVQGEHLKEFEKVLKKYGVDFAITREKLDPSRYLVFFKARDDKVLEKVMNHFAMKEIILDGKEEKVKPSILEKLRHFKEVVKNTPRKDKEKRKEQER